MTRGGTATMTRRARSSSDDAPPLFESLKAIGLGEEMVENLSLSQCEWTCEATVEKEVREALHSLFKSLVMPEA